MKTEFLQELEAALADNQRVFQHRPGLDAAQTQSNITALQELIAQIRVT